MKTIVNSLLELIEERPAFGYLGALAPTSAGIWALIDHAMKIGALISVVLGIAVGIVTYRVQRLQEKKLRAELENQRRQ